MRTHGKVSTYNWGCRCASCREVAAAYKKKNYQNNRAVRDAATLAWAAKNPSKKLEHSRKWRKENSSKVLEYCQAYRRTNPEKYRAHKIVANAIEYGTLMKPRLCEQCGQEKDLDAHHEDYEKPLEVEWLCRKCHKTR